MEYARCYNLFTGNPRSEATVLLTNTLDSLRDYPITKGRVLVFDEFSPGDGEQIIHMSNKMLKSLMNPMATATVRCRHNDLVIPPSVPRLFSANAADPQSWLGYKYTWSQPLQRRTVAFKINDRMVEADWKGVEDRDDDVDVAAMMAQNNDLPSREDESRIQSRCALALQRLFATWWVQCPRPSADRLHDGQRPSCQQGRSRRGPAAPSG